MAMYRKLGRKSDVRKALLRSQATALLANGKIITTEARAKEVAKVAKKDANGKRVKEERDGKKVVVYDEVQKEIKKDKPSRQHARRLILAKLYGYTEVEGRLSSENGEKMLADLKKNCEFFKILGTYKPGMRV